VDPAHAAFVTKYAAQHGVDPVLVLKVIAAESGGDPRATSKAGAQGLMQLMPATARAFGVTDPFDPEQNVEAGTRYLAQLLKRFPDQRTALAAYNFGPTNVAAGKPWPKETTGYVNWILGSNEGRAGGRLYKKYGVAGLSPGPTSVRIGGHVYNHGDAVIEGPHAGKVVAAIKPGGTPVLRDPPDLDGLLQDPDFNAYPLAERVATLRRVGADPGVIRSYEEKERPRPTAEQVTSDPDFKKFSPDAQGRILRRLVGDEAAEAHPAAVVSRLLGVR
jgi:Transglycosylase SLT domain